MRSLSAGRNPGLILFVTIGLACGPTDRPIRELPAIDAAHACSWVEASDCSIVAAPRVTLGSTPDNVEHEPAWLPVTDSRGRIFTAATRPGRVLVWSPEGEWVETLGTPGPGPGEIAGFPSLWMDFTDTLHVRDNDARWLVFGPGGRLSRVIAGVDLGSGPHATFLRSGQVVVGYGAYGRALYRVLDREGTVAAEFGSPGSEEVAPRRIIAAGREPDRFFSTPTHRFVIEEWSAEGDLLGTIRPDGTHFEASDDDRGATGLEAPPPLITDLRVDSSGLLWMLAQLPDGRRDFVPSQDRGFSSDRFDRTTDFLVEVVDPTSGEVVAWSRSDEIRGSISGFLRDGLAYRLTTDDLGLLTYEFLELGLVDR